MAKGELDGETAYCLTGEARRHRLHTQERDFILPGGRTFVQNSRNEVHGVERHWDGVEMNLGDGSRIEHVKGMAGFLWPA